MACARCRPSRLRRYGQQLAQAMSLGNWDLWTCNSIVADNIYITVGLRAEGACHRSLRKFHLLVTPETNNYAALRGTIHPLPKKLSHVTSLFALRVNLQYALRVVDHFSKTIKQKIETRYSIFQVQVDTGAHRFLV